MDLMKYLKANKQFIEFKNKDNSNIDLKELTEEYHLYRKKDLIEFDLMERYNIYLHSNIQDFYKKIIYKTNNCLNIFQLKFCSNFIYFANKYNSYEYGTFYKWHPTEKEMLDLFAFINNLYILEKLLNDSKNEMYEKGFSIEDYVSGLYFYIEFNYKADYNSFQKLEKESIEKNKSIIKKCKNCNDSFFYEKEEQIYCDKCLRTISFQDLYTKNEKDIKIQEDLSTIMQIFSVAQSTIRNLKIFRIIGEIIK